MEGVWLRTQAVLLLCTIFVLKEGLKNEQRPFFIM